MLAIAGGILLAVAILWLGSLVLNLILEFFD